MVQQYQQNGINIWSESEYVDVREYGAVGDGATDDTVAIQAAMDAVGVNGGQILVPPGTYLISDSLILPEGCSLVGVDREGCTIIADQLDKALIRGQFVDNNGSNEFRQIGGRIAHLKFSNTNRSAAGGVAIDLRQWTRMSVFNCQIQSVETGIRLENVCYYNEIRNTTVSNCIIGLTVKNGANSNTYYGGQISSNTTAGVDFYGGPDNSTNHFVSFGTSFEGNGTLARFDWDGSLGVFSIFFHGPRVENNTKVLEFIPDPDEFLAIRDIVVFDAHASPGVDMTDNDKGLRANWDKIGPSTSRIALREGFTYSNWYRESAGAENPYGTIMSSPAATQGALVEAYVIGIDQADPLNMYERIHRGYVYGITPTIHPASVVDEPSADADARIGSIGAVDSALTVVGNDLRIQAFGVAGKNISWWFAVRWLGVNNA